MENENQQKQAWGSMFGFVMSSIGYAVGLGAIWRFPYMIGTNGGGIFLLLMLIMSLFIAVPLIIVELTLGRTTQKTAIAGIRDLTKKGSPWVTIGWIGVLAATIMMSYYIHLTGTVIDYGIKSILGVFRGIESNATLEVYNSVVENVWLMLFYSFGICAFIGFIISKGVKNGVEKFAKYAISSLFIFLAILAVRSCTLEGAKAGIVWLFESDFSKLTPSMFLDALSQVFFLAGIGLSTAFAFGSYLPKNKSNIPVSGVIIVWSNMFVAVLSGLVIFPAVFSYNLEPTGGSSLVFQTMPLIFGNMEGGQIFGTIFFLLLFFAALTSCIALVEGTVATIGEAFNMKRNTTIIVTLTVIFLLSIIPTLSFTVFKSVNIIGYNLFDFMDFLCVSILIPVGGFLICIYTFYAFGFKRFKMESNRNTRLIKTGEYMKPLLAIIIPIIIIVIMSIGLM